MQKLFTIEQAAEWISRELDTPFPINAMHDLLEEAKLPICFKGKLELFDVVVSYRDDLVKRFDFALPVTGVFRHVGPIDHAKQVFANTLDVLRVGEIDFDVIDQKNLGGVRLLPLQEEYRGWIKAGYSVYGTLETTIEIPTDQWTFFIDDLRALTGKSAELRVLPLLDHEATESREMTKSSTETGAAPDSVKLFTDTERPQRKRQALIDHFVRYWPSIDQDLRNACRIPALQAAKVPNRHGYWFLDAVEKYGLENGKLQHGDRQNLNQTLGLADQLLAASTGKRTKRIR